MKNFFDRSLPLFEIVVRLLGNGWCVNKLDDCQYRIKLTSPEFKRYAITIRQEKDRLVIHGFVSSRQWHGCGAKCTVSPSRSAAGIAADIQKKILTTALEEVEKALDAEKKFRELQEKDEILKGMLSRLVSLEGWHDSLTGFKADNGLNGKVTDHFGGYGVTLHGLNTDQLIKLIGTIKNL